MNYAKIIPYDIANGEGIRTSLFVSGCYRHCEGCFNQELWDCMYGSRYTIQTETEVVQFLERPMVDGLSILGGDPLAQNDFGVVALTRLCETAHRLHKTVWLWTGDTWENVMELSQFYYLPDYFGDVIFPEVYTGYRKNLLLNCDVVVDGPFIESLSDRTLKWCGSSNQRVIDVRKTIEHGSIVLYSGTDDQYTERIS